MSTSLGSSWLHTRAVWPDDADASLPTEGSAFVRLWQGFTTARVAVATVILFLQGLMVVLGPGVQLWALLVCGVHLAAALVFRLQQHPAGLPRMDRQWLPAIGQDIVVFGLLQWAQQPAINYAPLLALPVLLAAIMGSLPLALGTAACVSLLLLTDAVRMFWLGGMENPAGLVQTGLTGAGYFVVAILANQLAARLAREEHKAQRGLQAAQLQQQVNQLVMDTLNDGVVVVDSQGLVRAINPAAWQMLRNHPTDTPPPLPFRLSDQTAWHPLDTLARLVLMGSSSEAVDVLLQASGGAPLRVWVRPQLTSVRLPRNESLCVLFLQDLRAHEARLRNEKMIAMGRMSTAVAHEVRNPLTSIAQANALLQEELFDPGQLRLSQMISQNTQRLVRMVEDILDVSRVSPMSTPSSLQDLWPLVHGLCDEWSQQNQQGDRLDTRAVQKDLQVRFEPDHLRRVLVNLLDNAARYASQEAGAIRVGTWAMPNGGVRLDVWSNGPPLELGVEQHLFEPFFSSESRSSGLGLFICRELCERHGATLAYARSHWPPRTHPSSPSLTKTGETSGLGNSFFILWPTPPQGRGEPDMQPRAFDTMSR